MIDEESEIESSPFCRSVTLDGTTVEVEIYRLAGKDDRWSLEVVDEKGASTVWSDTFETDVDANAEFRRTLESEGIKAFLEPPS
jgi:hypothetical protein